MLNRPCTSYIIDSCPKPGRQTLAGVSTSGGRLVEVLWKLVREIEVLPGASLWVTRECRSVLSGSQKQHLYPGSIAASSVRLLALRTRWMCASCRRGHSLGQHWLDRAHRRTACAARFQFLSSNFGRLTFCSIHWLCSTASTPCQFPDDRKLIF